MFPFIFWGVRSFIQIIVWSDDTIWPDLRERHHKNPWLLSQQQMEVNSKHTWLTQCWQDRSLIGSKGKLRLSVKIDIWNVGQTKNRIL